MLRTSFAVHKPWWHDRVLGLVWQTYASCAVVANGGASMREPRGGAAIDRHEAVFRFNFAQTAGYEGFVGSKTTVRVGNHETSRAFDEVIRQQPNARAALSAKGWSCDEYIQWSARYPAAVRSLCIAMHPTFYVMRQTLVQEYRQFYSQVCALIDEMPRCEIPKPFFSGLKCFLLLVCLRNSVEE